MQDRSLQPADPAQHDLGVAYDALCAVCQRWMDGGSDALLWCELKSLGFRSSKCIDGATTTSTGMV